MIDKRYREIYQYFSFEAQYSLVTVAYPTQQFSYLVDQANCGKLCVWLFWAGLLLPACVCVSVRVCVCVYECACALRISHANLVNGIRKHSRIKGFASGIFSTQNAEAIVSSIFLVDFKCLSSQQLSSPLPHSLSLLPPCSACAHF